MLNLPPTPRLVMPSVIMTDTKRKGRDTEFFFLLIASWLYFLDDGSLFVFFRSFYRAWLDTRFHLSSSITAQICQNRSCRTPLQYDSGKKTSLRWQCSNTWTPNHVSLDRTPTTDDAGSWTPEPSMYSEHTK